MRLIIGSNSGPSLSGVPGGRLSAATAGGLVPHALSLLNEFGGEWFFSVDGPVSTDSINSVGNIGLHPVRSARRLAHLHYRVISVETLLWLFHYLHDTAFLPTFDTAIWQAWDAYRAVNQHFAEQMSRACMDTAGQGVVLVNDYHLLLVPAALARLRVPAGTRIIYVHHVPWCEPDYFGLLPAAIRENILDSLLSCDTVTFHCRQWREAFQRCCERYLGARLAGGVIEHAGRRTRVISVPFPLDTSTVIQLSNAEATQRWRERVADVARGRQLLVRVDRLDLWKNHVRGFAAYQELLRRHPHLLSDWCFIALATPPRYRSARHMAYESRCRAIVAEINDSAGPRRSRPVELLLGAGSPDARARAIAGLSCASAVMVNPTYDGFNLVAKEAMLVSSESAILLSRNTGAYEYLAPAVEKIEPFDVKGTADALESAMVAGRAAHGPSAAAARETVRADNPARWLKAVLG
jgi:trehalose 6-phosphate synthase